MRGGKEETLPTSVETRVEMVGEIQVSQFPRRAAPTSQGSKEAGKKKKTEGSNRRARLLKLRSKVPKLTQAC